MGIQIFQYSESHLEGIRSILTEYMTFLANEMIKPPWKYNIEVENGVNFSMKNLDKFAKPDGRLFLVKVENQIAGTISMRKIREDSGEIKRMFVRPNFRGKKLGNLMIEEVIEPYLLQRGLIQRSSRGRFVSASGWRHLGLNPPKNSQEEIDMTDTSNN